MSRAYTLCIFLAMLATSALAQSDCEKIGGQCVDWRYYVCHAGVETGLCPGDSNMRCCLSCDDTCKLNVLFSSSWHNFSLPKTTIKGEDNEEEWSEDDDGCSDLNGDCFDNSNYCEGYDITQACLTNSSGTLLSLHLCLGFMTPLRMSPFVAVLRRGSAVGLWQKKVRRCY